MVASPRPPDAPSDTRIDDIIADRVQQAFARAIMEAWNNPTFGGRPPPLPPPPSIEKTIHNEVTKLKANTVNAAAIAFFIGGGIAPLVGIGITGFTILQAVLGLVWFFVGLTLHSLAQSILKGLLP